MAEVLGAPVPPNAGEPLESEGGRSATLEESNARKRAMLARGGIALWDVIASCDIKGSSDASIKNVVPTDVLRIIEGGHICAVVCNGAAAGRLYKRYLQWQVGVEAHVLPSTSPANAAWETERLVARWRDELRPLLEGARSGALPAITPAKARSEYSVVSAPLASSWAVHKSMQGNKRKDTKPELLVRARLREAGLGGYRLQWKVPGHPDIAWPGKRVAVEIRGCFWHRCPHCNPSTPSKNVDYWQRKFQRNQQRDAENLEKLTAAGWRVHVVWECQLKKKAIEATMTRLLPELASELGKELHCAPEPREN